MKRNSNQITNDNPHQNFNLSSSMLNYNENRSSFINYPNDIQIQSPLNFEDEEKIIENEDIKQEINKDNSNKKNETEKVKMNFKLPVSISRDDFQQKLKNEGKIPESAKYAKIKNLNLESKIDQEIIKNTFNNYYVRNKFKQSPEYKDFEDEFNYYDKKFKFGIFSTGLYMLFMCFNYFDSRESYYEDLNALINNKKYQKPYYDHKRNFVVLCILGCYLSWNYYMLYKVENNFKKVIYLKYYMEEKINMTNKKILF